MRFGDRELSRDRALAFLASYAVTHTDTVRLYDLAGDPDGWPGPSGGAEPINAVTLADIGRLVAINAGLAAEDVATLMDVDAGAEFKAVPATARLQDCGLGSDLYRAATALYDRYRLGNIGQAKRSKLLHLKRPWLVPLADSRVMSVYRRRADIRAAELGIVSGHWEAVRDDLDADGDDFEWINAQLSDHQDLRVRRLARLTSLRLLDIVAWLISDN
jgi:hypothetical protein